MFIILVGLFHLFVDEESGDKNDQIFVCEL